MSDVHPAMVRVYLPSESSDVPSEGTSIPDAILQKGLQYIRTEETKAGRDTENQNFIDTLHQ